MWLQTMPPEQAAALMKRAGDHRAGDQAVRYPPWYFKRWHWLPEGYLSERSVALYDRLVRRVYWAGSEDRATRLIARWLERTGARRVLELAPGPGRMIAALRERRPSVEFRGIELSPYFVAMARSRVGDGTVIHGDALDLGRAEGVFDAVLGAHYLGHIPMEERAAAFAAMVTAVRPGGSVITVEHRWHRWPIADEARLVALRGAGFSELRFFRRREGGIGR